MNQENWKTLIAATSLIMSIAAFVFSMNRINEASAITLENRMTILEKDVRSNRKDIDGIGDDTDEILRILRANYSYFKNNGDIVDFMCERVDGCTDRYGVLEVPQ